MVKSRMVALLAGNFLLTSAVGCIIQPQNTPKKMNRPKCSMWKPPHAM